MTGPALAAWRFGAGVLLGAGLGLCYGALRPLRVRHPHLADLIFVGIMGYAWLVHSFAVCRGDIRLGYTAGLILGCWGWEATFGRWLRPVFFRIWQPITTFFDRTGRRVKIFFNSTHQRIHHFGNHRCNNHIMNLIFLNPMSRQCLNYRLSKFI